MVDVLLGLQWGDEGKGKIVDYLARFYQCVGRFQGGPNAGHTLWIDGKKTVLHTIPSGIFHEFLISKIGQGVVVDPHILCGEIEQISRNSDFDPTERLIISSHANLILPTHRWLDKAAESAKGEKKIGSTLKGMGPTYMDKTGRNGLLFGLIKNPDKLRRQYNKLKEKHMKLLQTYPPVEFDLETEEKNFFTALEKLSNVKVVNTFDWTQSFLAAGNDILAEGAQGAMLDIDLGTYPFVTSSNTGTAGVQTGLAINYSQIRNVMGISKAYSTRVGSGPFPTEQMNATGIELRTRGNEFGSTTGRERRCGWLDVPQLRYAILANGVKEIIVTKVDVLDTFETILVCTNYEYRGERIDRWNNDLAPEEIIPVYKEYPGWMCDTTNVTDVNLLPPNMINYLLDVFTNQLRIPIKAITNGANRENFIPTSMMYADEPIGAYVG